MTNDNNNEENPQIKNEIIEQKSLGKLDVNYLNPILRIISGIYEFKNYFIDNTLKFKDIKKPLLSFVTSRLYYHFYIDKDIKEYNGKNFLILLKNINKSIGDNNNINPNEILIYILNRLHEEIKQEPNDQFLIPQYNNYILKDVINNETKLFKQKNNSIITETLNYCQIITYDCNKCNKRYFETKNNLTFQLNICDILNNNFPNILQNITLKDCLQNEFHKNNIIHFCKNCNSNQSFDIYYKFYEIGKKIIFLLDRDDSDFSKNIPYIVEEKIDFKDYKFDSRNNSIYELCGIISLEDNNNKNNKIFVTFIKSNINKKWYLCMDAKIEEKKDIKEVLNINNYRKYIPYTLMYTKIEEE